MREVLSGQGAGVRSGEDRHLPPMSAFLNLIARQRVVSEAVQDARPGGPTANGQPGSSTRKPRDWLQLGCIEGEERSLNSLENLRNPSQTLVLCGGDEGI